MSGTTEQLLIRFRGICGHIDLPNGRGKTKKKRTVLVRHMNGDDAIEHHTSYIEFYNDDVAASDVDPIPFSRAGTSGLARIDITEPVEIRFRDIAPGAVQEELGFERDVPHMSEILDDKVQVARALLKKQANDVDPERAMAVFDMPKGRLFAGEPEPRATSFPPEVTKFKRRRLAKWSDLYITYKPPLVVELVPLGGGGPTRTIAFRDSLRMLTIGNEPERSILGIFDAPVAAEPQPSGGHEHGGHDHDASPAAPSATPRQRKPHYSLYYNLLEKRPSREFVPVPEMIDGPGCPNNNYP